MGVVGTTTERTYTIIMMKRFIPPLVAGLGVAKHLRWYFSYQISGKPRTRR